MNCVNSDVFVSSVMFQCYHFIEISIKQCKSSGIDCKVHGLSIIGRLRSDEDDMAANFIFLASDNEEEEDQRSAASQVMTKKVKAGSGVKDIQTQVFVWGLNDKDQLGGPKGSKVGIRGGEQNKHFFRNALRDM